MNQSHANRHLESFRESAQSIELRDRKNITGRVLESLRSAMDEVARKCERLVPGWPAINERGRKQCQRDKSEAASQKCCAAEIALLAIHPKRHMIHLREQGAQCFWRIGHGVDSAV